MWSRASNITQQTASYAHWAINYFCKCWENLGVIRVKRPPLKCLDTHVYTLARFWRDHFMQRGQDSVSSTWAPGALWDILQHPNWPPAAGPEDHEFLTSLMSHQRTPQTHPAYSRTPQTSLKCHQSLGDWIKRPTLVVQSTAMFHSLKQRDKKGNWPSRISETL